MAGAGPDEAAGNAGGTESERFGYRLCTGGIVAALSPPRILPINPAAVARGTRKRSYVWSEIS